MCEISKEIRIFAENYQHTQTNMMITIRTLCIMASAILFAGCNEDANNNAWLNDPNAVHISASVGNDFTRSNPSATDEAALKAFVDDDKMAISNNGKSCVYQLNGSQWMPVNASDYMLWDDNNMNFQCWYPADDNNTYTVGHVYADQTSEAEMAKSDYMSGSQSLTAIPDDHTLDVALNRKMARLIFKISKFNNEFDANTAKINHVRMESKASTATGETNIIDIKPLVSGNGGTNSTYTALVVPGSIKGKLYLQAEGAGETPLVVNTGELEAGTSYTYELIVGKNQVTVGGIKVADWQTGASYDGKAVWSPLVTFKAEKKQTLILKREGDSFKYNLEYSVKSGTWKELHVNEQVSFGGDLGEVRLRGNNLTGTADKDTPLYYYVYFSFTDPNVEVECSGDIRTLLDYNNYETVDTKDARFTKLFKNCTVLTSAPLLPGETLANDCYAYMFNGCTALKSAPILPAKTLADGCYHCMFDGCTALEKAPDLPATTLGEHCYSFMFQGCTKLVKAPASLPAETLTKQCYFCMFYKCTSLKTAPKIAAKTLAPSCCMGMFRYCEKLEEAPELLAEEVKSECYGIMFQGCKALKTVQGILPAMIMEEGCYSKMFEGCSSLETAPILPATTLATSCYESMFSDCTMLTSVTMLAPANQIKDTSAFPAWIYEAGINVTTSRTLTLLNKDAYDALNDNYRLYNWTKSETCIIKDANGNDIEM